MKIEAEKYVLCPKENKLTKILHCDGCEFCESYDYQHELEIECNYSEKSF